MTLFRRYRTRYWLTNLSNQNLFWPYLLSFTYNNIDHFLHFNSIQSGIGDKHVERNDACNVLFCNRYYIASWGWVFALKACHNNALPYDIMCQINLFISLHAYLWDILQVTQTSIFMCYGDLINLASKLPQITMSPSPNKMKNKWCTVVKIHPNGSQEVLSSSST